MKKGIFLLGLFFLIFANASSFYDPAMFSAGKTLVLYDANSGVTPSDALMNFADFPPGIALPTFSDGTTIVDTTISGTDSYAGWVSSGATISGFPVLDRMAGVRVNFTVQVEGETHTNNDRAGFSVIILDNDAKGIELSFWENEIWVQGDNATGGLFKHGEGIAFATSALTEYQVTFIGDSYTLTTNARLLLTGPLRDYSAFDGFPDPYETPNFLFLGDDTSSSQARIRLRFVSVTGTEPVAPTSTSAISGPMASATIQPQPSVTPTPPLPATKPVFELCPSGWLVGVVMIVGAVLGRKINRQRIYRS